MIMYFIVSKRICINDSFVVIVSDNCGKTLITKLDVIYIEDKGKISIYKYSIKYTIKII